MMSMSGFQKMTVVSCVCVCVALLLPKLLLSGGGGGGVPVSTEGARFPPMLHRKSVPVPLRGAGGNRGGGSHNPQAIARAKGGKLTTGKSNLAGQIIPVYGFGILLYILYIIFKITSRGKTSQSHESRFPAVRLENTKRKITDFELLQLQERLNETEEVMERIVSRARAAQSGNTQRAECVSADQKEMLLLQLREITRVMQEGRLVDMIPSVTECEQELADDPEQIVKHWSSRCCSFDHQTFEKSERADGQKGCEKNELNNAQRSGKNEDTCSERMEQSEQQHLSMPLSGYVIRRRDTTKGTTRATESSQ